MDCPYCKRAPVARPERPVTYGSGGPEVEACESCWARIGRNAVRFQLAAPRLAYLDLDRNLTPAQIAAGHEIAARHGLLIDS